MVTMFSSQAGRDIKEQSHAPRDQAEYRLMEAPKAALKDPATSDNIPEVFARISWCESRDRQFDDKGSVLRGVNKEDLGKYQINVAVWGQDAARLGFDLMTEEGNEAMALYLYNKFGTKPWNYSRVCWGK